MYLYTHIQILSVHVLLDQNSHKENWINWSGHKFRFHNLVKVTPMCLDQGIAYH